MPMSHKSEPFKAVAHIPFPSHLKPADPQGPDVLARERSKATFSIPKLTEYIYGREWLARRDKILAILEDDPIMDKTPNYYLGRGERIRLALARAKRATQLAKDLNWTDEEAQMADWLVDEAHPYHLHKSMYLMTLRGQGTPEQHEKFLDPSENYELIGCYAQTELGHGSNVQGLETTATYDPKTQTFDLHSPTLTSSKWWIGSLGRTANTAVVMAQLISNGKTYGPHPFVVPIRDLKTHQPLPGVLVGDIGPKFGYNAIDNGFLLFEHVKIPHFNMLAKFARIDPVTGAYEKPPNDKLSYGTMTWVRSGIVLNARLVTARAATVAVRYCAIRRQFADRDAPKFERGRAVETAVLDYTTVQVRLLPVIAQAYALHFTGTAMMRLYELNAKRAAGGDFALLADLHASSSGLKSLCTTMAAESIEVCRRACGGHGFSMFSGLGTFYQDYLPNVTYEGDNYMLTQQVARYLLKIAREVKEKGGKIKYANKNPTIEYLLAYQQDKDAKCPVESEGDWRDADMLVRAFGHRAAYLVEDILHKRDELNVSWNSLLVDFYRASVAHCQFILIKTFADALEAGDLESNGRKGMGAAMRECCYLFGVDTMLREASEFLASGYLSPHQFSLLRTSQMSLLTSLRPNAVPLVDAFDFPDYLLQSSLGRGDGKVYEDMVRRAGMEPLNGVTFNVNYRDAEVIRGEGEVERLRESMGRVGKAKI
ncbi:hypothetical protein YB2330_004496 [Saitoella coloradoensis]